MSTGLPLLAFTAAAALLTVTPGLDTALVLRTAVAVSEIAFNVVKIAGAIYLTWLGIRLWWPVARAAGDHAGASAATGWFRQGFLTNMLNPKVGVFYVSFLPQFIPPDASVPAMTILMTAIHAALGLLWFGLLIGATRPFASVLANRTFVAWLDRMTGGLFVALDIRLVMTQRP